MQRVPLQAEGAERDWRLEIASRGIFREVDGALIKGEFWIEKTGHGVRDGDREGGEEIDVGL